MGNAARPGENPQVLIVGAGPTGLVLALWLTKFGIKVRIIDKATEPGTTSRAVAVHARTLEFYRQVGLAHEAVASGLRILGVNLWGRGVKAARMPVGDIGAGLSPFPFVLDFPQDLHERFLIQHLEKLGLVVERGIELISFEQSNDGVVSTLRHFNGSEETCSAMYLAGCDGARSAVRKGLGIGFPGGTYEDLFYVADVEASGPCIDEEIHFDLDYGQFVGVFPYKEKSRIRLIGTARPPAGAEARELTFDDVKGHAIEHMKIVVEKINWFSTYKVHHRVADQFCQGRAFVLGDAAHVHSPAGAQGMNTGIGDAVNLAWKLAAVLNGKARPDLLTTYEVERIAFARRLVATTDRAFTFVTKDSELAQHVRLGLVPRIAPWLVRLAAVRRFVFRSVSQINIRYRNSSLSEGRAGSVQGGDRLPWVEFDGGEDNFTSLDALAWQVHVYGEAGPGLREVCAAMGLPLHQFAWKQLFYERGLLPGAFYLLRPDGYIALIDADADPEKVKQYFETRGLLPG